MSGYFAEDRGAVAVIVAASLVVFMLMAALAVDVGYAYDTRKQLQAAADAAALAGCSVLIETDGNAAAAEAAARDYAARNANGAGSGLTVDEVAVNRTTEPWSVRVVVGRDNPGWFARVAGVVGIAVTADAKAVKTPLTGARYLLPWVIPILYDDDIDYLEAKLVNSSGATVSSKKLTNDSARVWSGNLTAPGGVGGYQVMVTAFNEWGVPEALGDSKGAQPAAATVVTSAAYPFASISLVNDYADSEGAAAITVNVTTKVAQPGVSLKVGKKNKASMVGSGTSWSYTITKADIDYDEGDFFATYPVDVYLGGSADGLVDTYVHIRRSTNPFASVVAAPTVVSAGGTVNVTVNLNDFDPADPSQAGREITLRVGSDAVETGNFGEANFGKSKLSHNTGYNPAPCPPDPPGVTLGNNVKDWVDDGYGGGIHIGDIFATSPGNSGWTDSHVTKRIAKYGDVAILPIVSKKEDKSGGSYDLIVRRFAAVRILDWDDDHKKGFIKGEFLEYVATPSSYGNPGDEGTAYASRLVNP